MAGIDPFATITGAILDQMGKTAEARKTYELGLKIAPNQPSLYANLGLSYAMNNELVLAETTLRKAVALPGANSQVRQNLALVIGLKNKLTAEQQTKLQEFKKKFAADKPPEGLQKTLHAKLEKIKASVEQWQSEGKDPSPVAGIMQEFEPLMEQGK